MAALNSLCGPALSLNRGPPETGPWLACRGRRPAYWGRRVVLLPSPPRSTRHDFPSVVGDGNETPPDEGHLAAVVAQIGLAAPGPVAQVGLVGWPAAANGSIVVPRF